MIRLVKNYLKDYIPSVLLNVLFVALQVILQTMFVMPETKAILDQGVIRQDMPFIVQSGVKMLLFTLASISCTVVASYLSAKVTAGVTCGVRRDCYHKVAEMSEQDFTHFGASTLLTRTMSDPLQIQIFMINLLRSSLMVPMIIVCMLVMIFLMNRMLFWILFPLFVFTIVLLAVMGARSKKMFEILQTKIDRINLLMREKLSGVRSIRAFRNQKLEEEKLSAANEEAYTAAINANAKINFLAPVSMIIMNWTVVLIYFAGTIQLKRGMASISDLLLIFQYLGYLIASLAIVPVLVNMLPKVSVSSQRILELLDYKPTVETQGGSRAEGITDGRIEFRNVIFGYTGAVDVIAGVSFVAEPGKTTAFIGTTGSGKTTIMNLLMGLYQMNFGDILIDGVSVRKLDPEYLRSRISYGTQRAMVFQDTVYNNVTAYEKTCTEERVKASCDAACFTEVLEKLPDGLQSMMSQGGMNISGGQRQRLSLARTLAKDADVYIFDDTFSALDAKTEATARKNIKKLLAGKTVIMVAQKISTIVDADQIIVLEKGHIVGKGRHEELLKGCPEYQAIYDTQCYMEKEGA